MKWSHWKIGTKLAVGFGFMLVLIGISNLFGYRGVKQVDRALVVVSDEEAPLLEAATQMQMALLNAMRAMDRFKISTTAPWRQMMPAAWEQLSSSIMNRWHSSIRQFRP